MSKAVVEQLFRPDGDGPMVYGIRIIEGSFQVGDAVQGPDGEIAKVAEIRELREFPDGYRAAFHLSPVIALREGDEVASA